jgi:DNA replication and repair protein RecF
MAPARIRRLTLTNFRSYHSAQVEVGVGPVVLVGPNGAGKTNLIEAISFLAPGRGLRRATLEDVAFSEGDGSWAVAADVEGALGLATLGTGVAPPGGEGAATARQCRIDREPVPSASAFADHLRVVWLVPAMDQLFNGPASERRRFLDRLVLAVDAEHMSRVNALERALRSRNRLLEDPRPDPHWLDAIEHETAELAVAVTALRTETVDRLKAALAARKEPASVFPAAAIALDGWMEQLVRRCETIVPATPPPGARWMGRISPISPSSTPARASPPPTPRPGSRRRCSSASCWRMPGCWRRCRVFPRCCCWTRSLRISTRRGAPRSTTSCKSSACRRG